MSNSHTESARGQTKLSAAGATPSNTAPATSEGTQNLDPIRVLRLGLDSLYVSIPGQISFDSHKALEMLQDAAKSRMGSEEATAHMLLGEHFLEVSAKGSRAYRYVLVDGAYRIQVSSLSAKRLPLAYVQVKSEWLTAHGPEASLQELVDMVACLGEITGPPLVSRADIFVDFVASESLTELTHGAFVSRARKVQTYSMGRICSGYTVGQGGELSARLYDKTREIEESGKTYLKPLWNAAGWEPGETVWRLEFQWRRPVLDEHGISTLADLLANLGRLWRYTTTDWLRLTIPNPKDKTQSRWPLHPVWAALAAIDWPDTLPGVSMPVRAERSPDDRWLFVNGLAPITSYMAVRNITDPEKAFAGYQREATAYHNSRVIFEGTDFEGYLREKAALKARRYNLKYDGTDESPRPGATPKAYRKAAKGG